ncbi:DUF3489 domain-containing protein [Lysobacter antibioticus]|uniref:DUF3489 domain-containing protein n=1 Tax=Lysobacter antibioticus TaxID=84531 RepID=A0A0S2FHN2_LYSAN|nr:DUF3489 domain-containing protein [Lysobacter antibioticus]ALN83048.1 hypothetical protein LA76x_4946 [Lysobacter antibioticus]
MNKLTDSQRALILLAIETAGRIENYPKNLGGGARTAVVRGLLHNGFIVAAGAGHILTDAGYEAVGHQPPEDPDRVGVGFDGVTGSDIVNNDNADANDDVGDTDNGVVDSGERAASAGDSADAGPVAAAAPSKRKETRVDQVVTLLMRPEGVTIAQVMAATDWQQHSVRGFFAGALKKKGYELISNKEGKADRAYRIKTEEMATAAEGAADEEE